MFLFWRKPLLGSLVITGALAACGPALSPGASPGTGQSAAEPSRVRTAHEDHSCALAKPKLPGTYVFMFSQDTIAHGSYVSKDGIWEEAAVRAIPAPPPEPAPALRQASYVYVGTYRFSSGAVGCAYMITSKNGRSLDGDDNTLLDAGPSFGDIPIAMNVRRLGRFVATAQVTSSNGKGTLRLMNGSTVVDTGVVTFTKRLGEDDLAPAPSSRRAIGPNDLSCNEFDPRYKIQGFRDVGPIPPAQQATFGWDGFAYHYEPRYTMCGPNGKNLISEIYTVPNSATMNQYGFTAHYTFTAQFGSGIPVDSTHPYVAVWEQAYDTNNNPAPSNDVWVQLVRLH